MEHTAPIRLVSVIMACVVLGASARSAEPYMPTRPKELDDVVRVGDEAGRILDGMPLEETSEDSPDDGTPRSRTAAYWMLMVAFNAVGIAFFIYGKKQAKPVFLVCGILLMVFPYFVVNVALTALLGVLLCAAPWASRRLGFG